MASQEDDNKLESKSNVNKEQERNFINVYKKYDYVLNSKIDPFPKKIEALIEIWKSVGQYNKQSPDIRRMVQIMDWAKLHTLNIVLTGKWKTYKDEFEQNLLTEVSRTQSEFMKVNDAFSKSCQKLADVIKNPWDDPILKNLLHDGNATIGPQEIEFFCVETTYLVCVRLKKLCESQCEDLALNLVTAFMNCYNLSLTEKFNLNATKTQILFCLDIQVALLYKYNKMGDIVARFKKLTLEEGLHLIRRFARKRIKISKVWKHFPEITFLACQVFVTAAITRPFEESGDFLKDLLDIWISFSKENSMLQRLEDSIRRIVQAATTAEHIYICCETIYSKVGLKTFTIELYIRALTTDMNNLESQKTENEQEDVEKTTKRLAKGFQNLADILKDNIEVSRECALTSFSLEPTLDRLRKIEDLARASGFEVLDTGQIWKCKLHPPVSPSDEICWKCSSCGDWMCKPNLDLRLTTNFALNEALNFEALGISPQLCDDLAVILNGPRYHLLSWLLRWNDLHRLSTMYLNDKERTKNIVTELKFVDVDYSMFAGVKREPVDEMAGIEKGYEHFLYSDMNEEIPEDSLPSLPDLPQPKSDPNTLRTLRMFRHTIKRNKPPQVPQSSTESNIVDTSFSSPSFTVNQGLLSHLGQASSSNSKFTHVHQQHNQQFNNTIKTLKPVVPTSSNSTIISGESSMNFVHNKHTHDRYGLVQDLTKSRNVSCFKSNNDFNSTTPNAAAMPFENHRQNNPPKNDTEKNFTNGLITQMSSNFQRQNWSLLNNFKDNNSSKVDSSTKPTSRQQGDRPVTGSHDLTHSGRNEFPRCEQAKSNIDYLPNNSTNTRKLIANKRGELDIVDVIPKKKAKIDEIEVISSESDTLSNESFNVLRCESLYSDSLLLPDSGNKTGEVEFEQLTGSVSSFSNPGCNNLNSSGVSVKSNLLGSDNDSFLGSNIADNVGNFQKTPFTPIILKTYRNSAQKKEYLKKENISSTSPSQRLQNISNKLKQILESDSASKNCDFLNGCGKNITKNNEIFHKVENEKTRDVGKEGMSKDMTEGNRNLTNEMITSELTEVDSVSLAKFTKRSESSSISSILDQNSFRMNQATALSKNSLNDKPPPLGLDPVKVASKGTDFSNKNEQSMPKNFLDGVNSEQNLVTETKQLLAQNSDATITETEQAQDVKLPNSVTGNSQDNDSILKSLSEQHDPIIVEKTQGSEKVDLQEKRESIIISENTDLIVLKDTNKPKPMINKELKIILYRLSAEVIKSFIPNYSQTQYTKCDCRRKTIGMPRKFCFCKFIHSRSPSPNRGMALVDYKKSLLDSRQNYRVVDSPVFNKRPKKLCGDTVKTSLSRKIHSENSDEQSSYDDYCENDDDSDTSSDDDRPLKPKNEATSEKNLNSKESDISEQTELNPQVVIERLPLNQNYVRSVLSNVPGLNDYEMIRPSNVNHIVNVVQISGGRPTSTVPVQNAQTSTQITPHIQRIGQPRSDKPELNNTNSETAIASSTPVSTASSIKPTTSQPSTLINILSQQIIRPGQSNCVRNRSSPLINILSQQIIRPASNQLANKPPTIPVQTMETQITANPPKPVSTTTEQPSTTDCVKTITSTKNVSNISPSGQGTILQFICKSTLPKFQQAFGKSVYQNSTETTENNATTSTETPLTNTDASKRLPKNQSVNIQPIQGGVIYTRQMPVGQTINLIPPGRGQVFRIATTNSDQISLVKDTVIHSKMSALLAAALQGKQKSSEQQTDGEPTTTDDASSGTRVTVTRPALVQNARIVKPVIQIPSNVIRTSPQSNLSSTTLEQLREFDMVYKQIKERSSTSTPAEQNAPAEAPEPSQRISVTYLNQNQKYTQLSPVVVVSSYCNLQPAASPALSVTSQGSSSPCVTPAPTPTTTTVPKVSSKSSKGKTVKNTTTQASKASPIPKPQQKPQEDEHTTQRIFDILAEYAEQLRNSPDLNNKPAPRRRSNPPTNPSQNSKRKKSSGSKKSGQSSSMASEADTEDHRTVGSEDSSSGVQISVQDEEQQQPQQQQSCTSITTAATTTTESNDSTSTSSSRQQLILTDTGNNQTRNLIIADSSVGEALKMSNTAVLVPGNYIMPVSMVKGGQQIAVVSGGSKILATVPARSGPNMLLFQSFLNQNRKSGVSTVKYSTLQPVSGISSQSIAGVSGQPPVVLPPNSHSLTAVALGQPITFKKLDEADRVNTELLLTISQSKDNNASTVVESSTMDNSTNTITSTVGNVELREAIVNADNSNKIYHTYQKNIVTTAPIATPVIAQTSIVKDDNGASNQNSITLNVSSENCKNESPKTMERVQSVLVTACSSNGPMLSHTTPRYRKPPESTATNEASAKEFLHNGEKQNNNDQKHFQEGTTVYFQTKKRIASNPQRLDREVHQLCLQRKQMTLERELRLQKSLSEECEDLGVDEPSTSDLFPEADILFDANHSPSFDQTSQDLVKRHQPQDIIIKEDNKAPITLFSDDDNSGSLRADFLFESVEYQTTTTELGYVQNQQLTNGQSSASNASGSSCGDATLLQNCASISDVTLNSPVSPDPYNENTAPTMNKYKFQYTNRRKGERHKNSESWTGEVSSSEDTTGSTELGKSSSHSPESCTNKHSASCDDELSDGSYKVVRVAISKSDLLKDEESCEEMHCAAVVDEDRDSSSPSGRGARRSVKKLCSCCNGSQDGGGGGGGGVGVVGAASVAVSRKRPASRPHTPAPHKKAFLNKKR